MEDLFHINWLFCHKPQKVIFLLKHPHTYAALGNGS